MPGGNEEVLGAPESKLSERPVTCIPLFSLFPHAPKISWSKTLLLPRKGTHCDNAQYSVNPITATINAILQANFARRVLVRRRLVVDP